ncbi:hypothetical protein [Klebsiella michiganensis]|uniref:hypothetical protein n=1 Tax=Klebsiella michiganensis TaxID=1134687 RepID=UPI001EE004FB|nr:hypothetical protein [Klebsiella michiganensis]UKS49876.1 hypothetical protein L3249_29690 [Klebsiella michiganensis]
MKKQLAYASNCSDSLYSYIYRTLQKRAGDENESLYQQAISRCRTAKEGANKQVISSQADSLIKISRIWADFFPANTSNQPI